MATTLYRLAEEILKPLSSGALQTGTNISINEIKLSICQVANTMLKTEHMMFSEKLGETIPNGSVVATYDDIVPVSWVIGKSKASLPIKPIKLKRNMGVWAVYFTDDPDNQFIPVQMGQMSMLRSQHQINGLLGQIGYENKGIELQFNQDLPLLHAGRKISFELIIMDISQYDDYTIFPILPEQEWQIKQEVWKLYSNVGITDLLVDPGNKQQQNIPVNLQKQSPSS